MKRTFIAIKVSLSREASELFTDIKLRLKDERIKWVDLANLHITLYFIGDAEEEFIKQLEQALMSELSNFKSFNLKSSKVGVFRNLKDIRAIWFGLEENENLQRLKHLVNKALDSCGMNAEYKKFKPHITLGRIKSLKNKLMLKNIVEENANRHIQQFLVKEVVLYESQLTNQGPVYKVLRKIELC